MSDPHGQGAIGPAPRYELPRLIASQAFVHASMAGLRMAAPLLALSQGYSAAAVGMLLSLFALTQVFLALPAGRYADRHGLKRPLAMAVGAAFMGAGLAAVFPYFPVLCLAALMCGGATGSTVIALQRHVGRASVGTVELRRAFSWLSLGPAISNFLGPLVAGLMIDHAGFRAAFLSLALLPLCSWVCVQGTRELPPVVVPEGARRGTALTLLKEASFRRLLTMNWLMSSAWDVHAFAVPLLGHERGLSASVIGSVLAAFAIAAAVVRVLIPLLASRLPEWGVLVTAMCLTGVVFGIYPFMHTALGMGACSVALGLVLGCTQPMVMSTLHQITPEHRHGEAIALRMATINATSVAMPMVFGAAGALVGVQGVFWSVGTFVAFGSRIGLRLRDRAKHS